VHIENHEKHLLASSCPSVSPFIRSVRVEQLGSYWIDFPEI